VNSLTRKIGTFVLWAVLALALIFVAGAVWMALVYGNLRLIPSIPLALPALVLFLWVIWRYLGGAGWPASTSGTRKALLRSTPVSRRAFAWSQVAGLLAVGALAGLWILLQRVFAMPPNRLLPTGVTASPVIIAEIVLGASLLAPVIEESAVRGYLQSVLERDFPAVVAVLLSSVVFAIAHLSQGAVMPKMFFQLSVGVTFGTLAYLNDSILPVMPVHLVGDLVFFMFVWPGDATRPPIAQTGTDAWFWLHVAQTIVCAALALVAFRRLTAVSARQRPIGGRASSSGGGFAASG
jgi:membrane protease YdiL (CAAX protease family)